MVIAENLERVRESIDKVARRAGRRPEEIALMAVSKTFAPERIAEAYQAGQRLFGENKVQEFAAKAPRLRELGIADAKWHMIGHLQSNKAAAAAEMFDAVDSVDSLRLAEKLDVAAGQLGRKIAVLVELNLGGEESKSGVRPGSAELEKILDAAMGLANVSIRGLMTVPPYSEDPESARPYFRQLRVLRDEIAGRGLPGVKMEELSMGMSHDFEVAVEEGSTCLRLGTAIFGERKYRSG